MASPIGNSLHGIIQFKTRRLEILHVVIVDRSVKVKVCKFHILALNVAEDEFPT